MKHMTIIISPKLKKEIFDVVRAYGYTSDKEFFEDALRRRVLDLKKAEFLKKVSKVKAELLKRCLTESDILKDFDKFYHQK